MNGSLKEFVIVNHGFPSNSNLYDGSCDGTWLMMKDLYVAQQWNDNSNSYAASLVNTYLNGTFLGQFDSKARAAIKQVKIPYFNGIGTSGSVASGSNGLSAKVFLLSAYEVGWSKNDH